MSTCPTKDLHSIYLDDEMPEIYKKEYETHVNSCSKCQKELAKIKALHELFSSDSKNISVDSHFVDQSYERLKIKMAYSKNTNKSGTNFDKKNVQVSWKYVVPAMAAAAAFAFVVPVRFLDSKASSVPVNGNHQVAVSNLNSISSIMTPSATNVSVGGGNGKVISGNIHSSVLSSTATNVNFSGRPVSNNNSNNGNFAVNSNNNNFMHDSVPGRHFIQDVDVFRPSFTYNNEGDKTISIKITVPGMNSMPVTTEIDVPVNVNSGQF